MHSLLARALADLRRTTDAMTESEIRAALIAKLTSTPAGKGASFIQEMFLDGFARRADLVVANGKLAAFEIKSERDTLDRLEGQLSSYLRFFEQVTIVCAEKHVDGVKARVPEHVGITTVSHALKLTNVRLPRRVDLPIEAWLSFIPIDELRKVVRANGLDASGGREQLVSRASTLSARNVREAALTYLKGRHARIEKLIEKKNSRRVTWTGRSHSPAIELREFLKMHERASSQKAIPRRTTSRS